jgi:hypothetical protein
MNKYLQPREGCVMSMDGKFSNLRKANPKERNILGGLHSWKQATPNLRQPAKSLAQSS